MKSSLRQLVLLLGALLLVACGPDYNKLMTKKVSAALGEDYRDYQSFSYPTSNYGLTTAYTPKDGRAVPSDSDFLCDMWNCIGVPDEKVPSDPKSLLSMNGFAAVGDNGAIITLTEKEQREFALNIALPEIYRVANVSGGFDRKQITSTSMTLGRVYPRKLRRKVMSEFIGRLPSTDSMKAAFTNGDLSLVVADVVIESMKVDVAVTAAGKQSLDAALGKDLGQVISNSKLGLKASSETEGKYTFEVTRPVIIKRLVKRQPSAGVLGDPSDDGWEDWISHRVELPRR